jgi:hypothetical protein
MNKLRSILTCLAIASLLVSDVVIAVHSASCSHGSVSSNEEASGRSNHCCFHRHCVQHAGAETDDSRPVPPEHDSDQCSICRGALLSRFAVVCDVVLPPTFKGLANEVVVTEVTCSFRHEFSTALSERGPPV